MSYQVNFCETKEQLKHLAEVVTGKADGSPTGADIDTSTLAYAGLVRETLPELLSKLGWYSVGEWSSDPLISNVNEYVLYNGIRYVPLSIPYQVNSAANPDPEVLVGTELKVITDVTGEDITEAQGEILGGSTFKGSNGDYVQNGDTVPSGTTHLRVLVGGVDHAVVAYYPQLSGVVSNLTDVSLDITYDDGGTPTTETCAIYALSTTDKTIELNLSEGDNAADILTALSMTGIRNATIKFPQNTKIYLDPISTRFQECIFELGSCHIVPTTENQFTWTNYGQRNTWIAGKVEPEGYSDTSKYEVMLWSNDTLTPNASRNKWVRPFMTGVHKGIIGYSDDSYGGACYRHEVLMPDITGTVKENAGGLGVFWDAPNGAAVGNSSGNDSKVIGGTIRKFESNLGASRAFTPKFIGVGSDGAVNAYQNIACSQMQIVSQYTEFCDNGLNLSSGPIGTQMIGGTVAASVTNKIQGTQLNNLPVYVVTVQGVPMRLDISVGYQSDGKLLLNGQNGVRLGLFDSVDNNLVSSVDLVQDGADGLKLSLDNMAETTLSIEVPTGKQFKFKAGSGAEVLVTDNGEIELSDNRYVKAGILMQVETTPKSLSYKGSYILNDGGTYYLAIHDGVARYRTQLTSF